MNQSINSLILKKIALHIALRMAREIWWLCRKIFVVSCDNEHFSHQLDTYQDESTRCAFLMFLLMGKALDWAFAV